MACIVVCGRYLEILNNAFHNVLIVDTTYRKPNVEHHTENCGINFQKTLKNELFE